MSLLQLLPLQLLRLLLGLDLDLIGPVSLLLDLLVQSRCHELNFLSEHVQSLFGVT